jgi:hypothetical protein
MNRSELTRRELEEEARTREPEPPASTRRDLEAMLRLQRTIGNAAVARSLAARRGIKAPGPENDVEDAEEEPQEQEEFEEEEELEEAAGTPAGRKTGAEVARWPWSKKGGGGAQAPVVATPLDITSATKLNAPDGTAATRTTIAVGEKVDFTGTESGKWSADSGKPTSNVRARTFKWTAPKRAATVEVQLKVGKRVAKKTMTVVEPASITATKIGSDFTFAAGTQGAGMKLSFKYAPLNVSFGRIKVKEKSGPATNITGYYLGLTAAELWHDSGETFTRIGADNIDTGVDTASFEGDPAPWTDGGWDWLIPNTFKVLGESGDGKTFTTVTQSFQLEGPPHAGRSTVSKAGVSTNPRMP